MRNSKKKRLKRLRTLAIAITLVIVAFAVAGIFIARDGARESQMELIEYSEYMELLDKGEIDTVRYNPSNNYMYISLHNDMTREMSIKEREEYQSPISECKKVYYPEGLDFKRELLEKGVLVTKTTGGGAAGTYVYYLFNLVFIFFLWRMMSGMMTARNGGAIEALPEDIKVSFKDVIGHDEVKEDLKLLAKQMKSKNSDWGNLTHGILFEGSAGTGKTMLAKALAKEAGFNFISVNSSSLIQMYVGLGAKRVRDAFAKARENAPCILFFDEIDAIGTKRGQTRGTAENDQTINAMLAEMDGFSDRGEVLVIAATNRAEDLDDALKRAGRFDRTITINPPQKWETREELFEHYIKGTGKKHGELDIASLAKQTVGFTGADISAVCREAVMIMLSKEENVLTQEMLEEAIDKIVFKGNRSSEERKEDTELVSYHESGHAVMTWLAGKPVARISIIGMTSGVGGAVFQGDEGRAFVTKESLYSEIMTLYAGRASEEIKFGKDKITNGAINDITKATELLVKYVGQYGFDDDAGLIDYSVLLGEKNTDRGFVRDKVTALAKEIYDKTLTELTSNYDKVELLAEKLKEVKTLSGDELQSIFNR